MQEQSTPSLDQHPRDTKTGQYLRVDIVERFWSKVIKESPEGCWIWTGDICNEYGRFWTGGNPQAMRAHRFSYELHYGPIPTGLQICHHCDNPLCVNPNHLYAGTQAQNMNDKTKRNRHGAWRHPEKFYRKLTPEKVTAIRQLARDGKRAEDIGAMFGVGRHCVQRIVSRVTWKHIP